MLVSCACLASAIVDAVAAGATATPAAAAAAAATAPATAKLLLLLLLLLLHLRLLQCLGYHCSYLRRHFQVSLHALLAGDGASQSLSEKKTQRRVSVSASPLLRVEA